MKMASSSRKARLLAILVLIAMLLPLQTATAQGTPPVPIHPEVATKMAAEGQASYWVILKQQADLSGAYQIADWNARGQYVVDRLISVANRTQNGLDTLLSKSGAQYTRFWIINAIYVTSSDVVLNAVSRLPEVQAIAQPVTFTIPEPQPAPTVAAINAVQWNISRIRADQVWSTYGATGQGIVVANIDTGVQYNHPALVGKYRGNKGGGSYDHNYNWYDPSAICAGGTPCDKSGHGTHTMGTMVGDDGGSNQIGVAPGAQFIMAMGCESNSCSSLALTKSAQWILAPTDLNGANARVDLRPQVVNNSWGGGGGNSWYQSYVQAWQASGIFPAYSNGNSGSNCSTSGSPGDYPESYAAGAFDSNNAIASFSSRGPSASVFGGIIKPNIAAPGVSVYSSVPTNSYTSYSGTSMASPHVAGTVALLWSAAPSLIGNIAQTRALLDQTAIDTSDSTCGGTAANNNVWGEGRLDAYAAVAQAGVPPTAPSAPSGLTATAISATRIDLVWTDNSNNETGFKIERATGSGAYAEIATVGAGVTTYANSTGLSPNTTYSYRIRASNTTGDSGYSNEATATTPAAPAVPSAPSNLTATAASATQINLAWADNSNNETGFKIERARGTGTYSQIATVGPDVKTYANSTGLSPNTTYNYRVRATNAAGDSAYSNVAPATTPAIPMHIGNLVGSKSTSSRSWTARVTITVHNASHQVVSSARVTGTWSNGGSSSCTTSSSGTCQVSKSGIPNATTSVTFTPSGITKTGYTYLSSANDVKPVTITR